ARIENSLRGAIGADRIHGMGRIAEQRDAPAPPARQGIAVDHRVLEAGPGIADEPGYVEPSELPTLEEREKFLEATGSIPVLATPRVIRIVAQLGNPVDERTPLVEGLTRDRIAHELLPFMPRHDHRAPVEERRAFGHAAPEDGAIPFRRAFAGHELRPE